MAIVIMDIDKALLSLYKEFGYNYSDIVDENGNGPLMQFINEQKLVSTVNDNDQLIDEELGDNGNPQDCLFSCFFDRGFPIPKYLNIKKIEHKNRYVFYIMQYCYKYGNPPSQQCM